MLKQLLALVVGIAVVFLLGPSRLSTEFAALAEQHATTLMFCVCARGPGCVRACVPHTQQCCVCVCAVCPPLRPHVVYVFLVGTPACFEWLRTIFAAAPAPPAPPAPVGQPGQPAAAGPLMPPIVAATPPIVAAKAKARPRNLPPDWMQDDGEVH